MKPRSIVVNCQATSKETCDSTKQKVDKNRSLEAITARYIQSRT